MTGSGSHHLSFSAWFAAKQPSLRPREVRRSHRLDNISDSTVYGGGTACFVACNQTPPSYVCSSTLRSTTLMR